MAAVPSQPLFSSDRERRLWVWTLAVVVAIYALITSLVLVGNLERKKRTSLHGQAWGVYI